MSSSTGHALTESFRRMFDVAIVCALKVESTAVEATFDDVYDAASYGRAPGDTNAYTLGRIGPHHVVLTYLPSIGKAAAAIAASRLALSFVNIRVALLVGICGGVPFARNRNSPTGIVLGDVVIGTGVIQYDFGRQYDIGRPIRKRSLDDNYSRASPEIRSFVHKCQAGMEQKAMQNKLKHYIEDLCAKDEFQSWSRIDLEHDLLYDSDYLHQHRNLHHCDCDSDGNICPEAREASCDQLGCSKQRTSQRWSRAIRPSPQLSDSYIHWGWMASGDSVMKSAKVRDDIAAQENIIAFDMEGSGLWDVFPTVIIKGVCDYADSHKNKIWQKYAAVAGAAGAKALLDSWVPTNTSNENTTIYRSSSPWNMADITNSPPSHKSRPISPGPSAPAWLVPFDQQEELIGRSGDVERLKGMLSVRNAYTRAAIEGLGGIGKSRLALEVALWAKASRDDVSVFWMQCSSIASFERDCRQVIEYLAIPGAGDLSHDPKVLMHRHLSQDNARRWLLILDSADDEELWSAKARSPQRLINYIPTSPQGSVLVTTRTHRIAVDVAHRNIVKIAELDSKDARIMLQNLIDEDSEILNDAAKTTQLLDHLTCLPLAIVQAAAYINQNSLDDIDEYLRVWNDQNEDEIMDILSEDFLDTTRYSDGQNPVAKTWLISFRSIKAQYPLAVQILSFMACLDPKDMLQSCLPPFGSSNLDRDRAFSALKNYAFIQVQQRESSDKSFDMHRLVHLAVRDYLRHEARFSDYVQRTARHLLSLMPRSGTDMTSYWHKYLHHAERVVATVEIMDDPVKIDLLEVLADAYLAIGSFVKSLALRQELTGCLERTSDLITDRLVRNITALSKTLIQQGRYQEALAEARKALDLYDQSGDQNDLRKFPVIIAMADASRWVGACAEALLLSDTAISISETYLTEQGTSRQDNMVLALQTLASSYHSLQRLQEEEEVLQRAINLLRKSANHNQVIRKAELEVSLARVYCGLEDTNKAERILIPVKRMFEVHLGRLHRLTLSSIARLGEVYIIQSRFSEAEALYRSLLSMYAEAGRLDDSDVICDRNSLVHILVARKKAKEAKDIQLKTIGMAFLLSGKDDALTLHNVETLSWCYWRLGRSKLALGMMINILDRSRKLLGAQHPSTRQRQATARDWQITLRGGGAGPTEYRMDFHY